MIKRRVGFGPNAFKLVDVYDMPDKIVYFESEKHLQILKGEIKEEYGY